MAQTSCQNYNVKPKETTDTFAETKMRITAWWVGRKPLGSGPHGGGCSGESRGRRGPLPWPRPHRIPITKRLSSLSKGLGSFLAVSPVGVGAQLLQQPPSPAQRHVTGGRRVLMAQAARGSWVPRGRQRQKHVPFYRKPMFPAADTPGAFKLGAALKIRLKN